MLQSFIKLTLRHHRNQLPVVFPRLFTVVQENGAADKTNSNPNTNDLVGADDSVDIKEYNRPTIRIIKGKFPWPLTL